MMATPSDPEGPAGFDPDGEVGVALAAAGSGVRMGGARKAFLELDGEPILLHSLRPFLEHPRVAKIAVALPSDVASSAPGWLLTADPRIRVVAGGRTRLESVAAALEALGPRTAVAIVHDAARPLVSRGVIDRCLDGVRDGEGAVAGWPSIDTVKAVDGELRVCDTPDRRSLWSAQTPQAFPYAALLEAYRSALSAGAGATDDAGVFERFGGIVRMVEGDRWNLKVTHPEDVGVAEALLRARAGAGVR